MAAGAAAEGAAAAGGAAGTSAAGAGGRAAAARPAASSSSLPPAVANDPEIVRRQRSAARDAGRRGDNRAATARGRTDLEQAYDAGAGASESAGEELDDGGRQLRVALPERGSAIDSGAGLILGGIVWAIAINWLRGGWPQARGWILAKLVNKPYGGAVGSQSVAPDRPERGVPA